MAVIDLLDSVFDQESLEQPKPPSIGKAPVNEKDITLSIDKLISESPQQQSLSVFDEVKNLLFRRGK